MGLTEIYATDSESAVWGPELGEYRDAITGARVRMLTQSKAKDAVTAVKRKQSKGDQ